VAEGSAPRARWAALLPLAWAATIAWLSHQPNPPVSLPPFPHADKLAHAGAFAILSALVVVGLRGWGRSGARALWIAVAVASLYGAADELHQSFVPGRAPDPWDWAADTAGALLGSLAVGLPRRGPRASIRG
jgi:VanZ family protein